MYYVIKSHITNYLRNSVVTKQYNTIVTKIVTAAALTTTSVQSASDYLQQCHLHVDPHLLLGNKLQVLINYTFAYLPVKLFFGSKIL